MFLQKSLNNNKNNGKNVQQEQLLLLNTVQWLFDFEQFDWFGGHRLSAHILVIDYIWKTPYHRRQTYHINLC